MTLYWDKEFGGSPLVLYPGIYSLNLTNHEPWNDDASSYKVYFPPPPAVTLNGLDTAGNWGGSYREQGATAFDYEGNSLGVVTEGSVGSEIGGVYVITYTATDSRGISGSATRTVYTYESYLPYSNPTPTVDFNGQHAFGAGVVRLPETFTVSIDVLVDDGAPWKCLLDIGGTEHGNVMPFRLTVGDPGQWVVALGDGVTMTETRISGSWTYGS